MKTILTFLLLSILSMPITGVAQETGMAPPEKLKIEPSTMESMENISVSFMRPRSGIESVGLSYYKIAEKEPDYAAWASKTKKVMSAPEFDRDLASLEEQTRLKNKLENYDIKLPLYLQKPVELDQYSPARNTLFLNDMTGPQFFSYDVYGQPIAVMVKGLDKFAALSFPENLRRESSFYLGEGAEKGIMELAVIPKYADHENLVHSDGFDFGPLLTEIAEVVIWNSSENNRRALWMWRAPWYSPAQNSELNDLFQGK